MLVLILRVHDRRYALPAAGVVEVVPRVSIDPLPHAPAWLAGLIRYRGLIVRALDLGPILGGLPCGSRLGSRIIIVKPPPSQGEDRFLGLVVDGVLETRRIEDRQRIIAPRGLDAVSSFDEVITDDRGIIPLLALPTLVPQQGATDLPHSKAAP